MFKRKLSLIMVMLLCLAALTACATNVAETTNDTSENIAQVTTEASTEATTEAVVEDSKLSEIKSTLLAAADEVIVNDVEVTFMDDSGREAITIAKNPKKVAVLYGSHASLYTEAGGKVSIGIGGEGAVKLYEEQLGRNILEDEGVVTIATSSSAKSWDVEAILAEQPDLIVVSTAMSGYSTIAAPAEAANIPVIAMTYSGVGDYLKWFKVFSNLNSKPELFETTAMTIADEVATIINSAPTENNPKIISLLPQSKALQANLGASDMGVIISELKGVNAADQLSSDVTAVRIEINMEDIFAAQPEMIFVQCIGSEEEARAQLEVYTKDNPVWAELEAVKNGKVYFMPKALFHNRPNGKYNESYRMMAELLYPEISLSN